jgi:hypothetical protein
MSKAWNFHTLKFSYSQFDFLNYYFPIAQHMSYHQNTAYVSYDSCNTRFLYSSLLLVFLTEAACVLWPKNCMCTYSTMRIHFNVKKFDLSLTLKYWATTASPALLTSCSPRVTSHRTTVQHGSVGSGSSTQRSDEELLCTAGHLHTSLAKKNLFTVLLIAYNNHIQLTLPTCVSPFVYGYIKLLGTTWLNCVSSAFVISNTETWGSNCINKLLASTLLHIVFYRHE